MQYNVEQRSALHIPFVAYLTASQYSLSLNSSISACLSASAFMNVKGGAGEQVGLVQGGLEMRVFKHELGRMDCSCMGNSKLPSPCCCANESCHALRQGARVGAIQGDAGFAAPARKAAGSPKPLHTTHPLNCP